MIPFELEISCLSFDRHWCNGNLCSFAKLISNWFGSSREVGVNPTVVDFILDYKIA
jgi:hypothetical protein